RERDAEGVELLLQPPDPDAEDRAPAGEHVERRHLLRDVDRMALREDQDAGGEAQLLGHRCGEGERQDRVGDGHVSGPGDVGGRDADDPVPRSSPIIHNATLHDWVERNRPAQKMMRTLPAALARAWARFVVLLLGPRVCLSPKRSWALAVAVPSSAALMVVTFALMGGPGRLERLPV